MKKTAKIFIFIIFVLASFSCSKTEIKNQSVEKEITQNETVEFIQPEKSFYTIEEYAASIENLHAKGGITIYDESDFVSVPEKFQIQNVNIFGIDGEYNPPKESITEVCINLSDPDLCVSNLLHIQIPVKLHEENPELYIEAEHDGKIFTHNNKSPIKFSKEKNNQNETLGYHAYVDFTNRNLYSKENEFILRLKNCKDDKVIATHILKQPPVRCNYAAYKNEFESPFEKLESQSVSSNEKYHLIYGGKECFNFDGGDMIVFSYGYNWNEGTKIAYIPFLAVKSKNFKDGVYSFVFSILESGQYKIDFYNEKTGKKTETSLLDYIQVPYNKSIKYVEKKGTEWKIDSAEGLRLRNAPWGEKIGLLEDGTELIQNEEIHYPFYDCIDGKKGFWIPVKRKNAENMIEQKTSPVIYADKPEETEGWVFTGYLLKTKN